MCGRYSQTADAQTLQSRFKLKVEPPTVKARYNIAPGQAAPVVGPARRLALMKWGLSPKWADPKLAFRMINARGETLSEKRAYAKPFAEQRCLVLADGFYEWKKSGAKSKTPYRFTIEDGAPFAFAGLFDNGTFTIVTTEANALVKDVHGRMPVILPRGAEDVWLDRKAKPAALKALLVPYRAEEMTAAEVSTLVNSPKNEGPEILSPAAAPPPRKSGQMELF